MSLVQDKESQQVVERRRQVRHVTSRKPVVRTTPTITVKTRYIERPVTRPSIWPKVASHTCAFAGIALFAYFSCSLTGHVMVEKARKELKETRTRTLAAKKEETAIRDRVNYLTRTDKIEEWAMSHGMLPIDGLGQAVATVANAAAH